jgi:hypothetical protein
MSYTSIGKYRGQGFSVYGKEKLTANEYFIRHTYNKEYDEDGFYICYFQVSNCIRVQEELRYGYPKDMKYDLGLVGVECVDYTPTLPAAKEKIEVLRKVENHTYCGFGVVEVKGGELTEIIPNEVVNITRTDLQAEIERIAKCSIS